jgi:hypothetical protein
MMIFEADEAELTDQRKCFGAYYDVRTPIYVGFKYEIACEVQSIPGTTMQFQLWLHDTKGQNECFAPKSQQIPPTEPLIYSVIYKANDTGGRGFSEFTFLPFCPLGIPPYRGDTAKPRGVFISQ